MRKISIIKVCFNITTKKKKLKITKTRADDPSLISEKIQFVVFVKIGVISP
jgi:hypothetical protein